MDQTLISAILDIPVLESFKPEGVSPEPENPGSINDQIPPDNDYYEEVQDLYDQETKTWRDKKTHSAEAEALVTFAEEQIAVYKIEFSAWKQEYDIQRVLQWRVYLAKKLMQLTEEEMNVLYITSSPSPAIDTDKYKFVSITELAENIDSFTTSLTGSPKDFQTLEVRIFAAGVQTIAWGASFVAMGVDLPTETVAGKYLVAAFKWYKSISKFGCMATAQEG